jgi:dephospho-CoA kinase
LLRIGLTGGVASGKSTVSRILKGLGAFIIDADKVARELVVIGSPYLDQIAQCFGNQVLHPDGSLNRKKLGDIVFNDKDKLNMLNGILHPPIISKIKDLMCSIEREGIHDRVVVDAAILIETGLYCMVDVVWLVKVSRKTQVERLMIRDGISREKAEGIIGSQMPLETKEKYADVVIDNEGSLETLEEQVKKLWRDI